MKVLVKDRLLLFDPRNLEQIREPDGE